MVEGCISKSEGCLDVAAANFDFSADRSCEDCCTYPLLSISLSQKFIDKNFSPTDTLLDLNGMPFRITDLKYFLSSWSWVSDDHHVYTVDSADITCPAGILTYTPDIILVDARQFQYSLGTIRQSPHIDSVRLKLGLLEALDCIDPASAGVPSVFSDKTALWDREFNSRATLRLVIQRDISAEIFDTLFIHTLQDIDLDDDQYLAPGIQATLKLTVNYAKWFSNVDILDLNSFQSSIESGVQGSFYKTPE